MSLDIGLPNAYIRDFYASLNCPRSLTCWMMYAHGEHSQLAGLDWNPEHYNSAQTGADSLAATKFLSKATFLKTGNDLRKAALEKFFAAEEQCRSTNKRLVNIESIDSESYDLIRSMRSIISKILGSQISAEEYVDSCSWGPGATTAIRRRNSSFPTKFEIESRISKQCYDLVAPWFSTAWPNWPIKFEINGASKIVTVPKNAKTDRTIAIEPGLNLWFQKGAGTLIRRKLLEHGVDLSKQAHNQDRSRIAARFNHLATVDFASASDTVSRSVVETLLPGNWFTLLNSLRSTHGTLDGSKIFFEKFSSMGNGFTFELETLIFYAAAKAVCRYFDIEGSISVYGDDVILPSAAYKSYVSLCAYLGFTINTSKSYSAGCYRESCGAHWWNGYDIKPIFLKDVPNGKTALLQLANAIRLYSHRRGFSLGCDRRFRSLWSSVVHNIGSKIPYICQGYGDIGLVVNFNEVDKTVTKAKRGWEGFQTRVWSVRPKMRIFDSHGLLLTKLQQIGKSPILDDYLVQSIREAAGFGNETPLPGRVSFARSRVLVPRWLDLGEWV